MSNRKYFIAFIIFIFNITSFSNAFSMELLQDAEEGHEIINIAPQSHKGRVNNPWDPKRRQLNRFIEHTLNENKISLANELGYLEPDMAPIETAYITYKKENSDERKDLVFNWDNNAIFIDTYDEKVLINYVPHRTKEERLVEICQDGAWAIWFGAASFALVPITLSAGGMVLDSFLPVKGLISEGVAWTLAVAMTPALMLEGAEFSRTYRGHFLPRGLTPCSIADKKPHVFPHDHHNIDRTIGYFTAFVRTAPYVYYLWQIEYKVHKATKSLAPLYWIGATTIPYCLHSIVRNYNEYMESRHRSNIISKNAEIHMLSEKKKLLKHSINQLQTLNNGKDSDKLVVTLDKYFNEIIAEKILLLDLKHTLENKNQDINKREVIFKILAKYAKLRLKEKGIEQDVDQKIFDILPQSLDNTSETQLYLNIDLIIGLKILENELKSHAKEEQATINSIYLYIQGILGTSKENKALKSKVKNLVEPLFMGDDYEQRIEHLLNIPKEILRQEEYLHLKNNDLSKSAASLGFVKYVTLIDYNEITDSILQNVKKMSNKAFSSPQKNSPVRQRKTKETESSLLIDDAQKLKDLNIEGIKKLHYDQDNLPPEPRVLNNLRVYANRFLAYGSLGRIFSTAYPFVGLGQSLGTSLGTAVAKGLGYGLGILDVPLRMIQEHYIQEDFFTNLRHIGSRNNDFWPIRWFGKGLAAICSLPRPLATAGIIFVMNPGSSLETKLMLSLFSVIPEFVADFQFNDKYMQDGITSFVTIECSPWVYDCFPFLKIEQARARNNKRFNILKKSIDEFDKTTTEDWYHLITEAV